MSNKASISHALDVLECKDHHKLIDVFNMLCLLSSQLKRDWYLESLDGPCSMDKEHIFIIRTAKSSVCSLAKMVVEESEYMHRSTVTQCLNKLIDMDILRYNDMYMGWEIVSMEDAFESSVQYLGSSSGYMELRKLFFTRDFYEMSVTMKKIIYYCCILMSTKGFKSMQSFIINLKNENSKWISFLNTDNLYYIKSVIIKLIGENHILRKIEQKQYSHRKGLKPKNRFLFILKPLDALKSTLKDSIESFKSRFDRLTSKYAKLYDYICSVRESLIEPAKSRADKNIIYNLLDLLKHSSKSTVDAVIDGVFTKLHSGSIDHPAAYIRKILRSNVINLHLMK
ncbi:hypothetical protein SAMN02745945_01762 [Peptoclostridium litorale DSM 5388]|uniref:Uncharacterized protein n=1 Tax=Peptoclostridium litorale DSM 5388 TaxID=1121324 RepID=A0A069RII6_PEPLI|nr:hypothetical protein [Peptoclostridium litorale]KDR95965.1 hypothetical protein CLIT_8c01340 [Peptoclostridium litorale DSM 5388]SIO09062.1 hypothetical protein SAMN02745945_01762 [Peptoclostridium litorale DSM 5388]